MRRVGKRTQPGGKTLDRHGIGRVCAHLGCETILSRYNSDPTCYRHTGDRNLSLHVRGVKVNPTRDNPV